MISKLAYVVFLPFYTILALAIILVEIPELFTEALTFAVAVLLAFVLGLFCTMLTVKIGSKR